MGQFYRHIANGCTRLKPWINAIAVAASVVYLIELVLYLGYERNIAEETVLIHLMRASQVCFALNIAIGLLAGISRAQRNGKILKHIIDGAVTVSCIVWIYPSPTIHWSAWIIDVLYSNTFLLSVLAVYSTLEICNSVMSLIGRRTNPALILAGSFSVFILIGSFLLILPKCTLSPISYTDSLFISTSAVCITGLCPVDIPTTFTPAGLLVLSCLIQIGGLGIITFTSFFAIFFSGTPSIYSQLMIRDMVYSKTINNLIPTLIYILAFTIAVELAGAAAIYLTIPEELGLDTSERLIFAVFHSLSSFCNAGFSCLPGGMSNSILMNGTQSIYVVSSIIIFAGAIGFPILVNIKDIFKGWLKRIFIRSHRAGRQARVKHLYDLNTKLVLVTSLVVLAVGSIGFFIFEYNNTLAGMSTGKKIIQSVFNALIPRSAGFASVNPASFLPITMLLVVIQMWIGGASQSLAGGIKVNTLAAVCLNLRAIVRGQRYATAFGRHLSSDSVRRANAVIAVAISAFTVYAAVILLLEPMLSTKSLLFEVTSAFFTVGSSLGITSQLSAASKMVLATAMFAGRVGLLSLLIGVAAKPHDKSSYYPADNIIIN